MREKHYLNITKEEKRTFLGRTRMLARKIPPVLMSFGVEEKNILLSECVGVGIAEGVRKREKPA
jgi:hypothetical protein